MNSIFFKLLDEVKVEVETCEELRSLSAQQGLSSYGATNKYNFINKAIDGMTISVNTVSITFKTVAFTASIQVKFNISLINIHFFHFLSRMY